MILDHRRIAVHRAWRGVYARVMLIFHECGSGLAIAHQRQCSSLLLGVLAHVLDHQHLADALAQHPQWGARLDRLQLVSGRR